MWTILLLGLIPYLVAKGRQLVLACKYYSAGGKTYEFPKDYTEPGVYLPHVQAALDFVEKQTKLYRNREKYRACDHEWDDYDWRDFCGSVDFRTICLRCGFNEGEFE